MEIIHQPRTFGFNRLTGRLRHIDRHERSNRFAVTGNGHNSPLMASFTTLENLALASLKLMVS